MNNKITINDKSYELNELLTTAKKLWLYLRNNKGIKADTTVALLGNNTYTFVLYLLALIYGNTRIFIMENSWNKNMFLFMLTEANKTSKVD